MALAAGINPRVTSGLAIGALVAAGIVLGGWLWFALTLLFFWFGHKELLGLMAAKQIYPSKFTVILFCLLFYIFAYFGWERHLDVVATMGVIFTFAWLLLRKNMASISDIGGTIMTFFYIGFLPAHFILLRQLGATDDMPFWVQPGLRYLFLLIITVSASDIFAYYGGKRFGKNLLSPQISPKKTVEGSLTGTIAAILCAGLVAWVFRIPVLHGLALGGIISVVAQVGDLSESLLKRDAGMKDSGTLIPGHGGMLDRTDSYIFSGAVAYYYINWFILHQGIAREVIEFLR